DTRVLRHFNTLALPGDDGHRNWNNLLSDLRLLILKAMDKVMVMPHPAIDPHPDHICDKAALREALVGLEWRPEVGLGCGQQRHG
ncbi:PIG-L family deacetylase, partial [Pseudomonas syringae pv. tagetis]